MQAAYNTTHDADLDEDDNESQTAIWLKRLVTASVVLLVLAGIGYGIKSLMSGGAPMKKQVTTIKLIPDTPPPPPPPPKEPPKEQLKEQPKEIKMEQPKPAEAPPAEQLKMEGAAGDGPSPFAAGAVNNEYKGGEVKTIGSDGGAKFNWYAGVLKNQIQDALDRDKRLKESQYKLIVSVWLKPSGEIEKLEWSGSDAEPDIQQAVKVALDSMPAMREVPPEGMPQPIKLRITARKMG
ncbi:MAG: TonB C-terminal domain-containing protein [Methylotenera sp.]|uniref:TonB C-terminal domain-containing protein n=1 Tax=Methylotenera sp. TaxID=2051956 RepID=UPI002724FB8B|nr:TonB C-terminal domain-containing protein [Methylotenera sp.]MDO9150399.1 TonB C-terminal domain-containing protein [Methylotenera sp.]